MASNLISYNSIFSSRVAACASALVLPIIDAAILLVVSVLVCLRITPLGA